VFFTNERSLGRQVSSRFGSIVGILVVVPDFLPNVFTLRLERSYEYITPQLLVADIVK
jgi:hypothetical protein